MKKGKAITFLTIISFLMACLIVLTFAQFPVGTKNFNGVLGTIETDYDIGGGMAYTLTLDKKENLEDVKDIHEVLKTLEYRLTALGHDTYSVKALKDTDAAVKDYDIRIEVKPSTNEYGQPDTSALASDIAVVAAFGEVTFLGGTSENPTEEILTEEKAIEGAKYKGSVTMADGSVGYQIEVNYTDYGIDTLKKLIEENNNSYYLTVKVGETELFKNSISNEYFVGNTMPLTTSAGEESARQFALQIGSGGLAYRYNVSEGVEITPAYGENAELISLIVVASVLVISIALFAILYKGYGVIAGLSLILFMLLELLMFIAVPGVSINIGGVVGVIFANLLAVDGLIIIARRIGEEYANGKMVKTAVKTGFNRSVAPIISVHVIGGIFALLLFFLTTGVLKGFAITFGIGVIISALATLVFARMFSALILPLNKYSDKFLNLKREAE